MRARTCVFCYGRFEVDRARLNIEGELILCEGCASLSVALRTRVTPDQDELPGRTLIPDFERSPRLRRLKAHHPFDRRQFSEDLETCRRRAKGELSRDRYNNEFLALYLRLFGMGFNLLDQVDRLKGRSFPDDNEICRCGHSYGDHIGIGCGECDECKGYKPDSEGRIPEPTSGACGDDHEVGSRMDDCFCCVATALHELQQKPDASGAVGDAVFVVTFGEKGGDLGDFFVPEAFVSSVDAAVCAGECMQHMGGRESFTEDTGPKRDHVVRSWSNGATTVWLERLPMATERVTLPTEPQNRVMKEWDVKPSQVVPYPVCLCGHRYDHHSLDEAGGGCWRWRCPCTEYRAKETPKEEPPFPPVDEVSESEI